MPVPDKKKSSYVLELERRANDTLIVYNPLDEDHVVEWDRRGGVKLFRVKAKSEEYLPRFLAEKYLKEMYTKIMNKKAADAIKEENQRRLKAGMAIMDKTLKTGEQEVFESKFYNINDDETRKIISILYVGVDREYGVDATAPSTGIEDKTETSFKKSMEGVQEEKGTVSREEATQDAPSEATEPIKDVPQKKSATNGFKCEYPGCNFVAKAEIGLFSHRKTHREDTDVEKLDEKKEEAVAAVAQ